jgi:hypothetical protein
MFVPVTTKPYSNSVNFIILQQGVPAFFLSIKEKTNKHITYCENSIIRLTLQTHGAPMVPFRVFRVFVFEI